jgi:hypothetical protein
MATAKFRHANSPDELAKREALAASGAKEAVRGFRHYNHPEEVAARARAQQPTQRAAAPAVELPAIPPPAPERVLALPASVVIPGPRHSAPLERLAALENKVDELVARLESRVDQALTDLFGTPEELQALRLTMANLPAIQEQGLDLRNRVRALEDTFDHEFGTPTDPPPAELPTAPEAAPPPETPVAE